MFRITKYPLLIEPLIKTSKERPAEQEQLRQANALVRVSSFLLLLLLNSGFPLGLRMPQGIHDKYHGLLEIQVLYNNERFLLLKKLSRGTEIFIFMFRVRKHKKVGNCCSKGRKEHYTSLTEISHTKIVADCGFIFLVYY